MIIAIIHESAIEGVKGWFRRPTAGSGNQYRVRIPVGTPTLCGLNQHKVRVRLGTQFFLIKQCTKEIQVERLTGFSEFKLRPETVRRACSILIRVSQAEHELGFMIENPALEQKNRKRVR
ncbi:MAG: hypothetical protein ACYC1T_11570 [Sulfuricaulis sp.]